ncbi:MAG: ABC transporter ATP-binding protein [Granulosicoccus sp.]|nr:ABC transporter ATP-binding protein [Granulosicoccus sp.]
MTNAEPIAQVDGAVKRFSDPEGGFVAALDGVNLDIQQGQFVTLLGPSGCGKTTLLRTISGFEDLDDGEITIAGQPMVGVPPHRRPVNTVFQHYALFPHLSVGSNVGYGLDVAGVARRERNSRVDEALERVGLKGFDRRKPAQLSGGQQQRVALARAIINRPKLLLLDEPLSALDRNLRQSMQLELKNLQHDLGICFLFVTHDQEEALTMSDQVVVLNKGKIEQIGPPEVHYHSPQSRFVAQFIGDGILFTGKINNDSDGPALITDDGIRLPVKHSAKPGATMSLLLRPEQLKISKGNCSDTAVGVLNATMEQSIFLGSTRKYVCRLANGLSITASPADDSNAAISQINLGESVQLTYHRDQPHLIDET